MPAWLIPVLKAILPNVATIVSATAPIFTKKSTDAVANQTMLLQQQITREKKRGRESFLDNIAAVSVKDRPCHAARASLLETSPIMSSTAESGDSRCLASLLTTPHLRRFWLRPTTGPGYASRPID